MNKRKIVYGVIVIVLILIIIYFLRISFVTAEAEARAVISNMHYVCKKMGMELSSYEGVVNDNQTARCIDSNQEIHTFFGNFRDIEKGGWS